MSGWTRPDGWRRLVAFALCLALLAGLVRPVMAEASHSCAGVSTLTVSMGSDAGDPADLTGGDCLHCGCHASTAGASVAPAAFPAGGPLRRAWPGDRSGPDRAVDPLPRPPRS